MLIQKNTTGANDTPPSIFPIVTRGLGSVGRSEKETSCALGPPSLAVGRSR